MYSFGLGGGAGGDIVVETVSDVIEVLSPEQPVIEAVEAEQDVIIVIPCEC